MLLKSFVWHNTNNGESSPMLTVKAYQTLSNTPKELCLFVWYFENYSTDVGKNSHQGTFPLSDFIALICNWKNHKNRSSREKTFIECEWHIESLQLQIKYPHLSLVDNVDCVCNRRILKIFAMHSYV